MSWFRSSVIRYWMVSLQMSKRQSLCHCRRWSNLQTQLTTTLRYVDEHGDDKEDFIGYTTITWDTTRENITDALVEKLEALDVNLSHIWTGAYNGTGEKC